MSYLSKNVVRSSKLFKKVYMNAKPFIFFDNTINTRGANAIQNHGKVAGKRAAFTLYIDLTLTKQCQCALPTSPKVLCISSNKRQWL